MHVKKSYILNLVKSIRRRLDLGAFWFLEVRFSDTYFFLHWVSFSFTQLKTKVNFLVFLFSVGCISQGKRAFFRCLKHSVSTCKFVECVIFEFTFFLKLSVEIFVYAMMFLDFLNSKHQSIININTMSISQINITFIRTTNFWVKYSCKLLLKASSWSFKIYGRIFDVAATSETQHTNLQWNKNSFQISLLFVGYSSLLTKMFIFHVTLIAVMIYLRFFSEVASTFSISHPMLQLQ